MAERESTDDRSTLPTPSIYGTVESVQQSDEANNNNEDESNPNPDAGTGSADAAQITSAMTKLDIGSNIIPVDDIPDCAVCLQKCIHPVRLPCSHVFCFLCVKGVAMQSGRCALCRKQITAEFFSNPTLLRYEKDLLRAEQEAAEQKTDQYAWYYEGRNGWWQYEERTNQELEESYGKKLRTFELLIAGFVYTIDLDNMVQMRRSDPSRRRRIKRDLVSAPKKGIAGLKIAPKTEGASVVSDASNRQVLGGETEKSSQATGGGPVDGATQTPNSHLSQVASASPDVTTSSNTTQRGTTTDDTEYEVLPQPRRNRTEERRHSHDPQLSAYEARGEATASATASSTSGYKSNRSSSASAQKKSKSARSHIRDSVPRHPSPRRTALQNDSYGLAVHHQRTHSSPSSMSSTTSQADSEGQGAISRHAGRSVASSSRDDLDMTVRSGVRRGDDGQSDVQPAPRSRQVRHRKKNPQRSSDV